MKKKSNEKLLKLILWKEVIYLPIYTILFNHNLKLFWLFMIIDRLLVLTIACKSIEVDKLIDEALENRDSKISNLVIFTAVLVPVVYILILMKYAKLFWILIVVEIIDYIVLKLIKK